MSEHAGVPPILGNQVRDCAQLLAQYSDCDAHLAVAYLGDAHRACQVQLAHWMRECGFDTVDVDAVGNVVGVYLGSEPDSPRLLTGGHYDTVRNAGLFDGRLGILVPMVCVRQLHTQGRRLPFGIEVVAFADEAGRRYGTPFLSSSALTGSFEMAWLDRCDAGGVPMRSAMAQAGLDVQRICDIKRDASRYLGFVQVHLEQGPVLNALDAPLGIVTSLHGSVRQVGEIIGAPSHVATPMERRRDAAMAVAELMLLVEKRATERANLTARAGMLEGGDGAIDVVPACCRFSLDIGAGANYVRDAMLRDVLLRLHSVVERRGLQLHIDEVLRISAAPCAAPWQERWAQAVAALGLPVHRLPSVAVHEAAKLHEIMPQAVLLVRGERELAGDDAQWCAQAFQQLLVEIDRQLDHHRRVA